MQNRSPIFSNALRMFIIKCPDPKVTGIVVRSVITGEEAPIPFNLIVRNINNKDAEAAAVNEYARIKCRKHYYKSRGWDPKSPEFIRRVYGR